LKLSQQQTIAAAVDQWITGIPGRIPDHAIFVENPDHASYAKELAGEQSIILVLDGDRGDDSIIPVSGFFNVAGEELLVGGALSLEVQDYVAIPFVNLIGVTVVRITTADDWQAFFDDADEAQPKYRFLARKAPHHTRRNGTKRSLRIQRRPDWRLLGRHSQEVPRAPTGICAGFCL
jgi:hypothetical protein